MTSGFQAAAASKLHWMTIVPCSADADGVSRDHLFRGAHMTRLSYRVLGAAAALVLTAAGAQAQGKGHGNDKDHGKGKDAQEFRDDRRRDDVRDDRYDNRN